MSLGSPGTVSSSILDETEVCSPELLGTTMQQVSASTGFDVDDGDAEGGDVDAPIPGTGTLLPQIILPSAPTVNSAVRSTMHGGNTVTVESLMRRKERSHQRTVFIAPDGSSTTKAMSVTSGHHHNGVGTVTSTTSGTRHPVPGLGSDGGTEVPKSSAAEDEGNPLPSTMSKANSESHVKRGVSFHEVEEAHSEAASSSVSGGPQRFNSDLSTTFGPGVGGSFRFARSANFSQGSHSFFTPGQNKNKNADAAAAAQQKQRPLLPTAAYGAEKVLLPTAKVLTRAMEKASSRAPPQKANIQESVHLILAKIAIPPSLASGAGSSSMQKQREANTHYMHKEMEHVLQARRSQKEMQEFQSVLEKLEDDATQRRRAHRRLLDAVPLPSGPGAGGGAGGGFGGTIGPAGAGASDEQSGAMPDSSTDEDADEEEVVASPRDEREKMRSMATSNALIKRINEREARRWLETQKKVIEDPGGLQILHEELQESAARLRASRISRRNEMIGSGDGKLSGGSAAVGALPAPPPGSSTSGAVTAMEKEISWVSLPSEAAGGGSRAIAVAASPNESRSMQEASSTLRHMGGSTATGTGTGPGQSTSVPGRTFSVSTSEPTMIGENERSSTAAASAPPASEAQLQRLLQRGNGRSIYGLERRGMTQKERAQENERRQHRLQQQAQSLQQQHSRAKPTDSTSAVSGGGGAARTMSAILRDDEAELDEALSIARGDGLNAVSGGGEHEDADADAEGGGGGGGDPDGDGVSGKPLSKSRKEVHFSTGISEMESGAGGAGEASQSRSVSQQSKEENASRSSSSSRSPSTVSKNPSTMTKKTQRPQRFQVLKKHTEPMPAAPGVGDRSAALMRNSILSLRRRSIAVEMQCGDDVKRTCNCIEQLYPLRVALLEHDLFGAYDVTHPAQWDAKYRRKQEQHRSKNRRRKGGPNGNKSGEGSERKDQSGTEDDDDDDDAEKDDADNSEEKEEKTEGENAGPKAKQSSPASEMPPEDGNPRKPSASSEKAVKRKHDRSGSRGTATSVGSSRSSSRSTQAGKGEAVAGDSSSLANGKPANKSSLSPRSSSHSSRSVSPDGPDEVSSFTDDDGTESGSRRRRHGGSRKKRDIEKKAFVDPGMMLEKHRRIIFDTALRMDDEDRKKACLEYITCLETLSKERIASSTWPSAAAAFERSRELLLHEPNKQNFAGFTALVNAHFIVEQLVEWPVQEMLRRLAGIFFVSQNQYRDWMAGLYQKMSNTHDYEGRFRAVDCTIKNKEIPTEAHVRITLHRARKLPRIDTLLAVPKISSSTLRRRSPTASDKTRTPSPGLGNTGPVDPGLEAGILVGGAENSDTGGTALPVPSGVDVVSTSSNLADLASPPGSKHGGSQTDFNATANSSLANRLMPPSAALALEDTLDDKNADDEKVVHVPEYAVRLTAERQIITSSAVPAGNSSSGGASGAGDGAGGDDGQSPGGKDSDATNTVTARQRVYFYDQTFKLHLYDVASVISVDLLSDGSLVSSGNFSIERYLHWKKTSLWLPLRGKYSRRPTELQLTIEVL